MKRTFWIPRGVVIPLLAPDAPEGPVLRLRIRRPEGDRETFKKDTKYYVLPGSCMPLPFELGEIGLDHPGQFGLPPREAHRRFLERFAELSA